MAVGQDEGWKQGNRETFLSRRAKLDQWFLYSSLWAFLQGRKKLPVSSHTLWPSTHLDSVMLKGVVK